MNSIRMWALFTVFVLLLWAVVILIVSIVRPSTTEIEKISVHEFRVHRSGLRLPKCSIVPDVSSKHFPEYDSFGEYNVSLEDISWDAVNEAHPHLFRGGSYAPQTCEATTKVAILIPYRAREQHLRVFLHNMHRFLRLQQVDYTIFVVNQKDTHPFNRGMLFNAGVIEALKLANYDCFILHDVDLLPESTRILYSCPAWPLHMGAAIEKFEYKLPGPAYVGGVLNVPTKILQAINGHSNMFWGWGAEDDDMFFRLTDNGFGILRVPPEIGRYKSQKHEQAEPNPDAYVILWDSEHRKHNEGLNTTTYELVDIGFHHLYTSIDVRLDRDTGTDSTVTTNNAAAQQSTSTSS